MNLFAINGGLLNGGQASSVIAAAATILCSASFSATTTRFQDALASVPSQVQITANPTVIRRAQANIIGDSNLAPWATHEQKTYADIVGTANVQVFVLREQTADAFFTGAVDIQAIPASLLGSADVINSSTFTASATRIQPGKAIFTPAEASLEHYPDALVTRYVIGQLSPSKAEFRVEPSINGVNFSYADITGYASTFAIGVVTKNPSALFAGQPNFTSVATQIQPGQSNLFTTSDLSGELIYLLSSSGAFINVGVSISANAVRTANVSSTGSSIASFSAKASMKHIGHSALVTSGSMSSSAFINHRIIANVVNSASMSSQAVRNLRPVANVVGVANTTATARRVVMPVANVVPTNEIVANPFVRRPAFADLQGSTELVAEGTVVYLGFAAYTGNATGLFEATRTVVANSEFMNGVQVSANAIRTTYSQSFFDCMVELSGDTIGNPQTLDPDERTFKRLYSVETFRKPAYQDTFRRTA